MANENLEMDAGAGESDYPHSLIFTSSKFVITAFGHDREHCEDVLQCVLLGRFKDHEGDSEFRRSDDANEHMETLEGILAMALDSKAPWIPWPQQISALKFTIDALNHPTATPADQIEDDAEARYRNALTEILTLRSRHAKDCHIVAREALKGEKNEAQSD